MRAAARTSSVRRARLAERDVLADRAVEQKVVLHHDANVRAVVAQAQGRDVLTVDQHAAALRMVERHHEADQRALSPAARSDERGGRAGVGGERDVLEHRHVRNVLEGHVVELDPALDVGDGVLAGVGVIFSRHRANLGDAIESGERFAHLRADRCDLHERRGHQSDEEHVRRRSRRASSVPARIERPPMMIISTPINPRSPPRPRRPPTCP